MMRCAFTTPFHPYLAILLSALDLGLYHSIRNPHVYTLRLRFSRRHQNPMTVSIVAAKATLCLGGIFSVALSVGLRPPGITWHFARWSPDFPL